MFSLVLSFAPKERTYLLPLAARLCRFPPKGRKKSLTMWGEVWRGVGNPLRQEGRGVVKKSQASPGIIYKSRIFTNSKPGSSNSSYTFFASASAETKA